MPVLCTQFKPERIKHITIKRRPPNFIELVKHDLQHLNISNLLSNNLFADPNQNYNILSDILTTTIKKRTVLKTVKFKKHKHPKTPWITQEIIRSIKFRDNLHLQWKKRNLIRS